MSGESEQARDQIRVKGLELAKLIRDLTPTSSEQQLAIEAVDRATMLALKSIALYQSEEQRS